MSESISPPDNFRERLTQLREGLMRLHKALVDSERISYEKNIGTIPSPNHFLQLLTKDPWFAWLHPVSEIIVLIDGAMDAKEPLTKEGAEMLLKQVRELLVASETGEGFARHYFDALQRDPDVLFAHVTAVRLLNSKKPLK